MKLLMLALYLPPFQYVAAFPPFPAPVPHPLTEVEAQKAEVPVAKEWECHRCGHINGDWTGICCKCGRNTRPR